MRLRNFLYKVWCRADNFLVYKETGCRWKLYKKLPKA
jgi:hypothetical protein